MRRPLLLPIAILALATALGLAACSDGKDNTEAKGCSAVTPGPLGSGVRIFSLEEAQQEVDFEISVPAKLPPTAKLEPEKVAVLPSAACQHTDRTVQLSYVGEGFKFALLEGRGTADPFATPVNIGDTAGTMEQRDTAEGRMLLVQWNRDGVQFGAFAPLSASLSERDFLEVLDSIP